MRVSVLPARIDITEKRIAGHLQATLSNLKCSAVPKADPVKWEVWSWLSVYLVTIGCYDFAGLSALEKIEKAHRSGIGCPFLQQHRSLLNG